MLGPNIIGGTSPGAGGEAYDDTELRERVGDVETAINAEGTGLADRLTVAEQSIAAVQNPFVGGEVLTVPSADYPTVNAAVTAVKGRAKTAAAKVEIVITSGVYNETIDLSDVDLSWVTRRSTATAAMPCCTPGLSVGPTWTR